MNQIKFVASKQDEYVQAFLVNKNIVYLFMSTKKEQIGTDSQCELLRKKINLASGCCGDTRVSWLFEMLTYVQSFAKV